MKRNLTIVVVALLVFVGLQVSSLRLQSHILRPLSGGLAGDPNESTCLSCHQYGPFNDSTRFVFRISADSAGLSSSANTVTNGSHYTPGYTQWVSITLLDPHSNSPVYGFQLTALNGNDSMAGSFGLANTSNTSMEVASGTLTGIRNYVGHANASGNRTWSFKWTAPADGNVTFYYNANYGNGDHQSTGDSIFHGTLVLSKGAPSGIADLTSSINSYNVYPVPFDQYFNVDLTLASTTDLSVSILTVDGQLVKELYRGTATQGKFSRSFDASGLASGVYLLRCQSAAETKVVKVLKYL